MVSAALVHANTSLIEKHRTHHVHQTNSKAIPTDKATSPRLSKILKGLGANFPFMLNLLTLLIGDTFR